MDEPQRKLPLAALFGGLFLMVVAVRFYSNAVKEHYSLHNFTAPKIDLNQADVRQLIDLPGIEATLAERIVEERQRGGPFADGRDLCDRVHGIGDSKWKNMLPHVFVRR